MIYCVLNERGKFCAKIFLHYTDIVIFVLGHFIATHPVVDSSKNRTFYPNSMPSYGGFVEHRGWNLTPFKSTFNAKRFIRRLSWSILNDFGAIHC